MQPVTRIWNGTPQAMTPVYAAACASVSPWPPKSSQMGVASVNSSAMMGTADSASIVSVVPMARRAFASFPAPRAMDEITPPPMPTPVPTAMMNATSGKATLMPAKPASPTACPTNTPSMMLYTPPNVNVIIVGTMYFKYSLSMPLVIMSCRSDMQFAEIFSAWYSKP